MAAPDYSGVEEGIKSGFNAQRQKAAGQEAANLQGQRDALARRQAALGGGPGGAFVKAEQQAGNESAQRLQQATAGIDDAQNSELRGVQMTKLGQQFQTSEREAGQTFQQGQQGRQFQHEDTSQATGIQAQSDLADKQIAAQKLMQQYGIDAQKAMQVVGINAQKDLQTNAQDFQRPFMEAQVTGQYGGKDTLAKQQFDEQTHVDTVNEDIAYKMLKKKDPIEQLFGNFSMGSIKGLGGDISDSWKRGTTSGGSMINFGGLFD